MVKIDPRERCVDVEGFSTTRLLLLASGLEHSGQTLNPSSKLAASSSPQQSHSISTLVLTAFLPLLVHFLPGVGDTDDA